MSSVIVTAYDEHALQAFEAGAVDFLLKPVGERRLLEAIKRARRPTGNQAVEQIAQMQEIAGPATPPRVRRIVGKIGEEYFPLSAVEVYAFQVDGDMVWIRRRHGNTLPLNRLSPWSSG